MVQGTKIGSAVAGVRFAGAGSRRRVSVRGMLEVGQSVAQTPLGRDPRKAASPFL